MTRHLNIKAFFTIFVSITIATWAALLITTDIGLVWSIEAIKKLPQVISIDLTLWFIFTTWLWKLQIFQGLLVPFPYIEGTWTGHLKSTWVNPETGESPAPIPVKLIIKQSFSHICCRIYTGESRSKSYIADFDIDKDSGATYLVYSYANQPGADVRHRSEIHNGTAQLEISDSGKQLVGNYWTDRKTTGKLELEFSNRSIKH
jgi:hypothetical protein